MNFFKDIHKFKNKTALYSKNNQFSFNELVNFNSYLPPKIKERTLIALICENKFEVVASYVSLIRMNCVLILIDSNLANENIKKVINTYNPDYIFNLNRAVNFNLRYETFSNIKKFQILKKKNINNYEINKNLALLLPTSGSTGSSKYVRLSNENITINSKQIINSLKIKETDRSITTMPLNYTYGMSILNTHLISGSSIVLNNHSFIERDFWEILNNRKVTNFGGVPFMYETLIKLNFQKKIPKSLKYITQAGGKLQRSTFEAIINISNKSGLRFYSMYGQTEATSRMSVLDYKSSNKKIMSIGKPLVGGKFLIQSKNGKLINEPDKVGELIYIGKNVSLGYCKSKSDLSKGNKNKYKLYTGDLAYKDKDNFYYISGRKKRVAKIFGIRIGLDEVETMLKNWGIECAVISDDKKIYIFMKKNKGQKFINKVSKNLGLHKSALKIIKVKNLPRNQSGKISYSELEKNV